MRRPRSVLGISFAAGLLLASACGTSGQSGFSGNGPDGSAPGNDGGTPPIEGDAAPLAPDAGGNAMCGPTSTDMAGCSCSTAGATQPCYNGPPTTRHVGTCRDGTQTCVKNGEFNSWSTCTGATLPAMESCTSTVDSNCNGKMGCADPACATDPSCNTGCTNGQTRSCYTGPAGTENVGTCKDGTQTCANNAWPSNCPGEVLPGMEVCTDPLDHNCNGLPGCFDFIACIGNPACNGSCQPNMVDPGCSCPMGTGDSAQCPAGTHGVSHGTDYECCPCKASDCATDTNCCSESVCQGNSACAGVTCTPLPSSCGGMTNADCDDFPEDCDEPCCRCSSCADGG